MLWACFALPQLPLEAAFLDLDQPLPRAATDGPANRPLILCADAAARALGVRRGQTLAGARAFAPRLLARRRDERIETRLLEVLAAWAYGLSSQVCIEPPDAVLLEVGASLRLFGGWPALERRVNAGLTGLGHAHVLAAAPTPSAARVLAGCSEGVAIPGLPLLDQALAGVPLDRARLPARQAQSLASMGLRTLGELFRLPRPELGRRVGKEVLTYMARLRGTRPDPRPLYRPPDHFARAIDLDGGVEGTEGLLFALQRLTRELSAFVTARDGGVARFELRIGHEDAPPTRVAVGLRKPGREAGTLFELARGRLERTALAAPAVSLALHAEELPPFVPERRDLFDPTPRGPLDWDALAERLRARLGDDAVRPLSLYPDHRPERAWRIGEPDPGAPPGAPARPLWLLPRPEPFHGRIARMLRGPERIETGWWDGFDVRRDYFVAELETGQRAWLFREVGGARRWMLHGWFG